MLNTIRRKCENSSPILLRLALNTKVLILNKIGLLKTSVLSQRGEVLAIDLFELLVETLEGYNHILVSEDLAMKWTELYPLKVASSENSAKMLIKCGL